MEEIRRVSTEVGTKSIRWSGFSGDEIIEISALGVRQAFADLGVNMSRNVKQMLRGYRWDYGENGWSKILDLSYQRLEQLEELAESGLLVVNGINFLARYLEAFEGYCAGAGISRQEGAYLQIELEAGCQTLMVQDALTKEIRMIHTEEDMDHLESSHGLYRYRVVLMEVEGRKLDFFAYPGLCGWGPAFGINETTGLVMSVDDLYIKPKFNHGTIWANVLAFMVFDAGNLNLISELLKMVGQLEGDKFNGGYSIHLAQILDEPQTRSFEFAGDKLRVISPVIYNNRIIVGQSNCPLNQDLQIYSEAAIPTLGETWTKEAAELYVEMNERKERLVDMGMSSDWLGKTASESVKLGLKMLAEPYGDLGRYIDNYGHVKYFISSLPSRVTVAHMTCYLGKGDLSFYAGKLRPQPILGEEYSTKVNLNYRFGLKKIWEEAEKIRREFAGKEF